MSTRSNIGVVTKDNKLRVVYCHSDGYPSWNGNILLNHYTTQEKVEELISNGDMSLLDKECTKPDNHSYEHRIDGYTVYYGRDRGEDNTEFNEVDFKGDINNHTDLFDNNYGYIFFNDKWYFNKSCGKFKKLTKNVIKND